MNVTAHQEKKKNEETKKSKRRAGENVKLRKTYFVVISNGWAGAKKPLLRNILYLDTKLVIVGAAGN